MPFNDSLADLSDEITASFRRFGPLFVDWPHKAESKSYFPPKGDLKPVEPSIILPACELRSAAMMCAFNNLFVRPFARICIPAVPRWELCSGPDWCLHSGGWQAVPVCLQPHHQRQACEFVTLLNCWVHAIHLAQHEHKCSLTRPGDLTTSDHCTPENWKVQESCLFDKMMTLLW